MARWSINKLAGNCGACLEGVSLASATSYQLKQMRSALFEHGVIVMPEQYLSPDQHIKLVEFFGEIDVNRFFTPVKNHPLIAEVRTLPEQTLVIGGNWHTDHSYDVAPAMCSILSAKQLPPFGGDTHFASMAAAYRAMSLGLQNMLKGLRVWHSDSSFSNENSTIKAKKSAFREPVVHPVIIKHPHTGTPCVYVNADFTINFENWSIEESVPLLSYLYSFITKPIFITRVIWKPGMVVIWDN